MCCVRHLAGSRDKRQSADRALLSDLYKKKNPHYFLASLGATKGFPPISDFYNWFWSSLASYLGEDLPAVTQAQSCALKDASFIFGCTVKKFLL